MPAKKFPKSEKPEKAEKSVTAQQTAPPLSGKLLKQISTDEAATESDKSAQAIVTTVKQAPADSKNLPETSSESNAESPSALDDTATDKAVDDIVAQEGDIVLAVEDARTAQRGAIVKQPSGWQNKIKRFFKNKWTWVGVVLVLVVLLGLPITRYKLLGLMIKKSVTITVLDSKNDTPVSNAEASFGGTAVKTDGDGQAKVRAPVGKNNLVITKQYYKTSTSSYFVGFKATSPAAVHLVATGRLVPITVLNTVTGQPLKGAEIRVLDTTARTNIHGQAIVAVPTIANTDPAKLILAGYNTAAINLQVTSSVVKANSFTLTPTGQIYFLSNRSGTIDVVKTNLDGTGRQTVLAGTGQEDPNSTSLLASRDWQYLVLKAKRESGQPALYLIDTSDDKVTEFDNSNSTFSLIGWYGHDFIYDETSNTAPNWQAGREVIKSYDADNQQLNQLDQNQAEGDASSYAQQIFANFYLVNDALVYDADWSGFNYDLSSDNNTIRAVEPTGQGKKDYQSFPASTTGLIQATLYQPQGVYYAVYDNTTNTTTYYEYEDQEVQSTTDVDQDTFNQGYPTYLLSPSGNQTFWTELRDGQNTLFTGDANAKSPKQIASLSDYAPYGWYSDNYVLVSKDSSELYIMPASGLAAGKQPLKITDYYKPAQTYTGYGYGYGGL
jgi:hypothetical protein